MYRVCICKHIYDDMIGNCRPCLSSKGCCSMCGKVLQNDTGHPKKRCPSAIPSKPAMRGTLHEFQKLPRTSNIDVSSDRDVYAKQWRIKWNGQWKTKWALSYMCISICVYDYIGILHHAWKIKCKSTSDMKCKLLCPNSGESNGECYGNWSCILEA